MRGITFDLRANIQGEFPTRPAVHAVVRDRDEGVGPAGCLIYPVYGAARLDQFSTVAQAGTILLVHASADLRSDHCSNYRTNHSSNGSALALPNARSYGPACYTAKHGSNCLAVAGAMQNAVVAWPACAFVSRVARVMIFSPSGRWRPWRRIAPRAAYAHHKHQDCNVGLSSTVSLFCSVALCTVANIQKSASIRTMECGRSAWFPLGPMPRLVGLVR